jgi:hypothetical protein
VVWDGGNITGSTGAFGTAQDVFLDTRGIGDSVTLLSGTITASAKSIVKNVKNRIYFNGNGVRIGDGDSVAGSQGKILTIKHYGTDQTRGAIEGDSVLIGTPGIGSSITIESDVIAVKGKAKVQIGGTPIKYKGNDDSVAIQSTGVINITGWVKTGANPTGAIVAGDSVEEAHSKITVLGTGNGKLSSRSDNVVIKSTYGRYALYVPGKQHGAGEGTTVIRVTGAKIEHYAANTEATNTNGAAVFYAGLSAKDIYLDNVYVTGTQGKVTGQIAVNNTKSIFIKGGLYGEASNVTGSTGNALTAKDSVVIEGARITSITATGLTVGTAKILDYVVKAKNVVLKAGSTAADSAVIAWLGTADVGGIFAEKAVRITANGSAKSEVRLGAGAGDGIKMIDDYDSVIVRGNSTMSAFIKVGSGKAIDATLHKSRPGVPAGLLLDNAVVSRKTAPAAGSGKDNLIDVRNTNVKVDGSNSAGNALTSAINVAGQFDNASASTGVSIVAYPYDADSHSGGAVLVVGGEIGGNSGAIWADSVAIASDKDFKYSDKLTRISSSAATGVNTTIKANTRIHINNSNAVIKSAGTAASGNAVLYSQFGNIDVYNVDTVLASSNSTALLTTVRKTVAGVTEGAIKVNGGVIRSATGIAVRSTGPVTIDKVSTTGKTMGPTRRNITVTSAATSETNATVYVDSSIVEIGKATVEATGASGLAPALQTNYGKVRVDSVDAKVTSVTGSAIKVTRDSVKVINGLVRAEGRGTLTVGKVVAAVYVDNGNALLGASNYNASTGVITVTDADGDSKNVSLISGGNALAVYATGAGNYDVVVSRTGIMTINGSSAAAGGIQATGSIGVTFAGRSQVVGENSPAFTILAATGTVRVTDKAEIISKTGNGIRAVGGKIIIDGEANITGTGASSAGGTSGRTSLISSARDTYGRAGAVWVTGNAYVYNEKGATIKAEDTVRVLGNCVVKTATDTAIYTGNATSAGVVEISGGTVWAGGGHTAARPVAINSKQVFMTGGKVFANTERESWDDDAMYDLSKATGILIRNGAGMGKLRITGGEVRAFGPDTAIVNKDTNVTVEISANTGKLPLEGNTVYAPLGSPVNAQLNIPAASVKFYGVREWSGVTAQIGIRAGNRGTAIKSDGNVTIWGSAQPNKEDRTDAGLRTSVYIGSGNGVGARAIYMPVVKGLLKKTLQLGDAFVEAGSDGAVAIEADTNALVRVDSSAVLVRHASTGILGKGGVYVNAGYVEVLATEDNKLGTAIAGRQIRISGGRASEEQSKSEVHSKGITVEDIRANDTVQVTGTVHMSGVIKSHLSVGSSVLGDTATLTVGSGDDVSRELWRLSTAASNVTINDKGKALVIPNGITVKVADNGSLFGTGVISDTIRILGTVTTVGNQAGARFTNKGKVIVDSIGNVAFNKNSPESFKNDAARAIIVLREGAKLDGIKLVHDTGINIAGTQYTFLKYAKQLSGDTAFAIGTRGPGRVIVPPVYATLYGNQTVFVDEVDNYRGDTSFWNSNSERTDSAYTLKYVKYPIDKRYKKYLNLFGDIDASAPLSGDTLLSGPGTVFVDEGDEGTVLLTEAGRFSRVAKIRNEAGEGQKTYIHNVSRVDLNRIQTAQSSGPIFFDGFFNNLNKRVVDHDDEARVTLRGNDIEIKYTGKTANLLDGVIGAPVVINGRTQRNKSDNQTIYYDGLGVHQYWYRGVSEGTEGTFYPLQPSAPVGLGTYEILASFQVGNNFVSVPSDDRSIVPLGTVTIVEGDVMSIFNKVNNDAYQLVIDLEAGIAKTKVYDKLPSVARYGAKYGTIGISGNETVLTNLPVIASTSTNDSTLTFAVGTTSVAGQSLQFTIPINNTVSGGNIAEGQYISVRVRFLSHDEMVEATPSYISVNYRDNVLTGLIADQRYSFNGVERIAQFDTLTIDPTWPKGDTMSVKALPEVGSDKRESAVAKIYLGSAIAKDATLEAIRSDSASTSLASDGRLTGTNVAMEYRLDGETAWKPASAVVTPNLRAGTYQIRYAATDNAFASEAVTVRIFSKAISVAEGNREVPVGNVTTEAAVAPVSAAAASFTAGPSPASTEIKFFSAKQVKSGSLYIFDANGNSVAKVSVAGAGKIGGWNLKDKNGAAVAEGTYIVKGALVGKDGTKEKVSFVFSVVK